MLDVADVLAIMIGFGVFSAIGLATIGYCSNKKNDLGFEIK